MALKSCWTVCLTMSAEVLNRFGTCRKKGECKWTTGENGKQLTAELLRKANLLPFAKNYTIVPVLFLKNAPKDDAGNAMLSENVVELMK